MFRALSACEEKIMKIDSNLYRLLTYKGALPFVACAILPIIGISQLPLVGEVALIAKSYGLLILSFLCGIHWGTYLYKAQSAPFNLFITSNVIVVSVWIVSLILSVQMSLIVLVIGFGVLLLIEAKVHKVGLITQRYFTMRRNVSLLVMACLMITALHVA